jgi:hypothetical protein
MLTSEVLEHWSQWAFHRGSEAYWAIKARDDLFDEVLEVLDVDYSELLIAIGLNASYRMENELRARLNMPWCTIEVFLASAAPAFLTPQMFLRAMQAGIVFSMAPQNAGIVLPGLNGGQNGGGLGRDHRVGSGAQRVYPLRRQPK